VHTLDIQCVFYTPSFGGKLLALGGAPLPSLPLPLEVGPLKQGRFYIGAGGHSPPPRNVGQAPQIFWFQQQKIRIVKIYAIFVQWRNQHSHQLVHKK